MYQLLKFENPIPSCEIHSLEYHNNKWFFIYALNTPFELNNDNNEELIIYEYISDLYLKKISDVHAESVNIKIKTLDNYLKLLELQRNEDIKYRENWIKENPDEIPNKLILENKNYSFEDLRNEGVHYISSILESNDEKTIFSGI